MWGEQGFFGLNKKNVNKAHQFEHDQTKLNGIEGCKLAHFCFHFTYLVFPWLYIMTA